MKETLKEKINDISLMLVMTTAGDMQAIELLLELCNDFASLALSEPEGQSFSKAVSHLKSNQESSQILSLIQEFINSVTEYLENSRPFNFPVTTESATTAAFCTDQSLLTEYIETHNLLLEEFESSLLDFQNNGEAESETKSTVKRYLHNLKGDSGSIGLSEIESACHDLEDELEKDSLSEKLGKLLQFKKWVHQCLESYSHCKRPVCSTFSDFLTIMEELENIEKPEHKNQSIVENQYVITGEREILLEFAAEAEEHLNNVESVILEAEGNYSKDAVDTIFRGVHSIKGGSAYFSLEEMTKCSHILENFLSEVRDGKREIDSNLSALLLKYIDLQKNVLSRARDAASKNGIITRSPESQKLLESLEEYKQGKNLSNNAATTPAASDKSDDAGSKTEKLNLKNFVKVDTARLDLLIDSIGEMVIYSSMLVRQCRELLGKNESVMDTTHRVEKFSRDLQDIGMSMRLVPVKGLFQKMSRLVWDTSKKLGKEVIFSMEGEDTELDRNLIDKLADPLMHMVRNSLDHGIESTEERLRSGKPAAGKVKLSASHAGGNIHIKIQDDGRGLNPEKLIAKAVEKGIISAGQKLTDSEAFQLIFAAGFSTAAAVTDISGRGVGMDVVRRNVESLRGRIHIQSAVGKGSEFTIEIPLTLAIIDGIQVLVGSETFIIPSLSIVEFIRPKNGMVNRTLDQAETLNFRGKYLPLYRLSNLYDINAKYENCEDATAVIINNNNELVALMVDDIIGECSTVIKSLGNIFGESKGVAGCAIMPQGNVALILDVRSIIKFAREEYKFTSVSNKESLYSYIN